MTKDNILSFKVEKSKKSQVTHIGYFVPDINRNRTDMIEEQPHIDLLDALKKLSPFLAHVFHAPPEAEVFYEATGFKYNGDKIIITGKVVTEDGGTIGISSPGINMDENTYRWEEDLYDAVNDLTEEVYQFLIGKKVGVKQLSIEDEIEKNESDNIETIIKSDQEMNDELVEYSDDDIISEDVDPIEDDDLENEILASDNKDLF